MITEKSLVVLRGSRTSLPPAIAERLARQKAEEQQKYKRKLKLLKRSIMELVFENGALCDQVAEVQQQVVIATEERRFLLKRLSLHQNGVDNNSQLSTKVLGGGTVDNIEVKKVKPSPSHVTIKRKTAESSTGVHVGSTSGGTVPEKVVKPRKTTKPKQLCPPITLDSAGRPIFPITLGPLTIHSLGEIVSDRPAYHSDQRIYPVGFCSSRTYASLSNPLNPVLYTCKIIDGGYTPRFEVVCEEEEDLILVGSSPAEVHSNILSTINNALGMDLLTIRTIDTKECEERASRFFGLSHPSVQNVLQACPGARKCTGYKWVKFEVCRSEAEVDSVFDAEKEASLCHQALLRNIRFARHHVSSS